MNYSQSVKWVSGLKRHGIKLGLERFRELLRMAGDPQHGLRCAHIAGTNGKGSTASMIACAMQHAGYRVGLYLSPYVFDFRERIQLNGKMIPTRRFAELATEVRPLVEHLAGTSYDEPTEFEVKTLIGLMYFAEENVDFASVEVGMGGRLDATNVVLPDVSVITNVSYDHMAYLGNTLKKIASEKAGIIKQNVPVVEGCLRPAASRVVMDTARRYSSAITVVRPFESIRGSLSAGRIAARIGWVFDEASEATSLYWPGGELAGMHLRLRGSFQAANAGCALGALLELQKKGWNLTAGTMRWGIQHAWLPGRLQVFSQSPLVIADGAHNPAGAEEVAGYLRLANRHPVALVVGMMASHEPHEVLAHLGPLADLIVATQPPGPGERPAEEIAVAAGQYSCRVEVQRDVNLAIQMARQWAGQDGLVCITGSFYLVGAINRDTASGSSDRVEVVHSEYTA